ncbi:MAG: hypothetical protein M0P71_00750 [Melioribacteraceae bacterium]|nr:hypothetical protein [Melioribacteraceae bacterium]
MPIHINYKPGQVIVVLKKYRKMDKNIYLLYNEKEFHEFLKKIIGREFVILETSSTASYGACYKIKEEEYWLQEHYVLKKSEYESFKYICDNCEIRKCTMSYDECPKISELLLNDGEMQKCIKIAIENIKKKIL